MQSFKNRLTEEKKAILQVSESKRAGSNRLIIAPGMETMI